MYTTETVQMTASAYAGAIESGDRKGAMSLRLEILGIAISAIQKASTADAVADQLKKPLAVCVTRMQAADDEFSRFHFGTLDTLVLLLTRAAEVHFGGDTAWRQLNRHAITTEPVPIEWDEQDATCGDPAFKGIGG